MLASTKQGVRFEACEELRLASESSEVVVAALEKALYDPDQGVADAAKRALEADVHARVLARLDHPIPITQEQARRIEESRKLSVIIIVTTPSIEGHRVSQYLGVVSSEIILGTGFLSELGALFADFFGTKSNQFQAKLAEAKDAAMTGIRRKAYQLGANAIIGLDLDYSVLGNNMLMVVANGTAVYLEP